MNENNQTDDCTNAKLFLDKWLKCSRDMLNISNTADAELYFNNINVNDGSAFVEMMQEALCRPEFANAVWVEGVERLKELQQVSYRLYNADYKRETEKGRVVWSSSACKLLKYSRADDSKAARGSILLIPSLINRYYILDLIEKKSFAQFLCAQNFDVYMVDWGEFSDAETSFNIADYITNYLEEILSVIQATQKADSSSKSTKIHVLGHCLGGLLALALTQLQQKNIASLALLATPWDFHAAPLVYPALSEAQITWLENYITHNKMLSGEQILALFYLKDAFSFYDKINHYQRLKSEEKGALNDAATQEFLAVEHWVNSSVALTQGVARDCFVNFAAKNNTRKGEWEVSGQLILLANIDVPTFIAAPVNDKIVPPETCMALCNDIKNATYISPNAGHIGMIIGKNAKKELWSPYVNWLLAVG